MIDASDLLTPVGPIDPSFFPGYDEDKLNETLSAYITDAAARVGALPQGSRDEATRSWALWRAFDAISLRLMTTPAKQTIDKEGSREFTGAQATLMRQRANDALTEFRSLVTASSTSVEPPATQTGSVGIQFTS